MRVSLMRGTECIERHIHVHTHGAKRSTAGVHFAEETGWLPPVADKVYSWDEIPELAQAYGEGRIDSYFPVFQVNPL
jgi:hypothetical protein